MPGYDLREHVALKLLRAVDEHRVGREPGDEDEERRGGAHPGDLLDEERVGELIAAVAAELDRVREADEPRVAVGAEGLPGELGGLVGLGGVRGDLLLGEAPDGGPQLLVLSGQQVWHRAEIVPPNLTWASATSRRRDERRRSGRCGFADERDPSSDRRVAVDRKLRVPNGDYASGACHAARSWARRSMTRGRSALGWRRRPSRSMASQIARRTS